MIDRSMIETVEVDYLVIGAGVVGLAVAERLSRETSQNQSPNSIILIDRHFKFGQEASSRNSEVIHAGIYYPVGSRKAFHCVRGRQMLYELCELLEIPHRRCGKFIVAFKHEQGDELEALYKKGLQNGAPLERVLFENRCEAIWSPETGIVDSHQMMAALEQKATEQGVAFFYQTEFLETVEADENGCLVLVQQQDGTQLLVKCRAVINSAGLGAGKVLKSFDAQSPYTIRPCRGRYYSLSSRWNNRYQSLLYPMPDPRGGLGVHLTLDLAGMCRLGPDVDWSHQNDDPQDMSLYQHEDSPSLKRDFFEAALGILPDLKEEDLSSAYVGVRCKLFKSGQALPEFVIQDGLNQTASLHLLGIESPGLTSSLSIAKEVADKISGRI